MFRAAFRSPFRESLDDRVHLPDDTIDVFKLFLRWLYPQKLTDGQSELRNLSWTLLFDLYVFADKCDTHRLQNKIVEMVIEKPRGSTGINIMEITWVYDHLAPDCALRRLLEPIPSNSGTYVKPSWATTSCVMSASQPCRFLKLALDIEEGFGFKRAIIIM